MLKVILVGMMIASPATAVDKQKAIYHKARMASVTYQWQGPLNTYTGGSYGVDTVNSMWRYAPKGKRRGIVLKMAAKHRVPARLLLGVWGAESGFGRYACHFGLTGYFPGTGTSGNFTKDADIAGRLFRKLYRARYGHDSIR